METFLPVPTGSNVPGNMNTSLVQLSLGSSVAPIEHSDLGLLTQDIKALNGSGVGNEGGNATVVAKPVEVAGSKGGSGANNGGKENELFMPDEAYNKQLPKFTTPGTKSLPKYDEWGNLKQIKYYDDYGREIGWIDYSNHGYPDNHTVPHWHEVQWSAQYPIGGYQIDHRMDMNPPLGN